MLNNEIVDGNKSFQMVSQTVEEMMVQGEVCHLQKHVQGA